MNIPNKLIRSEGVIDRKMNYLIKARSDTGNINNNHLIFKKFTHTAELNYGDRSLNMAEIEPEKVINFVKLDTLINFKYDLKKPIEVIVIKEGSDVIGEIADLGIYAFGKNEFEVLREINFDLTELFEEIMKLTDAQLGKRPKYWKKILSNYISMPDGN